jgi:hypothetical protein
MGQRPCWAVGHWPITLESRLHLDDHIALSGPSTIANWRTAMHRIRLIMSLTGSFLRRTPILIALTGASVSAQTTIYSNIAPGDTFTAGTWAVLNSLWPDGSNNYRTPGARFTVPAGAGAALGSIEAPLGVRCTVVVYDCVPAAPDTRMTVWLNVYANNGAAPGALLARSEALALNVGIATRTFTFQGAPLLAAGQTYWLQADAPFTLNVMSDWSRNQHGSVGLAAWGNGTASHAYNGFLAAATPAFSVMSAVPEPAGWLLFGLALPVLTVAAMRRTPLRTDPDPGGCA